MNDKCVPVHRDSVAYWRDVTSRDSAKNPTPRNKVFERYLLHLGIQPSKRLLDVGVGFGRLVPACLELGADVYGIDIDPQMIKAVQQEFPNDQERFFLGDSIHTKFADEYFQHIVCWGVFDELAQAETLLEMGRILMQGGTLLLTGKNSRYEIDDDEALAAEEGARAKNHPNYFTDIDGLVFECFGFALAYERYFKRRGDFARDAGVSQRPARFYEYLFVLKKVSAPVYTRDTVPIVSGALSATYKELKGVRG